jgi:hypothetical protein
VVKNQELDTPEQRFSTNIRRLIYFHHRSAREAAKLIGVSEHAASVRIICKRLPNTKTLMRIADVYCVEPGTLMEDPYWFASSELGNMERLDVFDVKHGSGSPKWAKSGDRASKPAR